MHTAGTLVKHDAHIMAASMCFIRRLYPSFLSMDKIFLSMDKTFLSMDKTFLSKDKTFLLMDKTFLSMDKAFSSMDKILFTSEIESFCSFKEHMSVTVLDIAHSWNSLQFFPIIVFFK